MVFNAVFMIHTLIDVATALDHFPDMTLAGFSRCWQSIYSSEHVVGFEARLLEVHHTEETVQQFCYMPSATGCGNASL